jgi:hypothetical protein
MLLVASLPSEGTKTVSDSLSTDAVMYSIAFVLLNLNFIISYYTSKVLHFEF